VIEVKSLYKSFGKNDVLKGINIKFQPNQITAVLGPNSSGKTTLMKSLLGMVIPDKGDLLIDGASIVSKSSYRDKIGYLPQIARFPENLTVAELLEMIRRLRNTEAQSDELVKYFELEPYLDKRLGHLSGGTRQKVNIVQAFMFDSPYLFLDEPTAGLDPLSLVKLKELILKEKEKGKTILITSHIMSFVEEMADEVVFILDGQINFRGHPQQIKDDYMSSSLEGAIAKVLDGLPKVGHSNGHHKKKKRPFNPFIKSNR